MKQDWLHAVTHDDVSNLPDVNCPGPRVTLAVGDLSESWNGLRNRTRVGLDLRHCPSKSGIYSGFEVISVGELHSGYCRSGGCPHLLILFLGPNSSPSFLTTSCGSALHCPEKTRQRTLLHISSKVTNGVFSVSFISHLAEFSLPR